MFNIRKAERTDTVLIHNLIYQLAVYEKLEHAMVATPEILEQQLFDEKAACCVIAFEENNPVGFALYFFNFSTFLGKPGLYLEDLFVIPEFRGKGYGKALLLHLKKIAIDKNCGRMEWSVLDWNTPSIEFYKSLGAVAMEDWTVYRMQL